MTQIAADPADALQAGIFALLNGDTDLGALVMGVYDGVPEDVTLDDGAGYVVVGEMTATPAGAHDAHGRATSAVVHTWTRAQSNKAGNDIAARVVALLSHQHAALGAVVTGHKVGRIEHSFSQTLVDPEPGIRHRVDRFTIWTSQEGA